MTIAISSPTHGYLEPCNCGGQRAGGLARRAAIVAEWRTLHPDLVLIDTGELLDTDAAGGDPARLPVIARTMAYLGVDLCTLGNRDLGRPEAVRAALDAAAVPVLALAPGREVGLPAGRVIETGGRRVGVMDVAFGAVPLAELVERVAAELRALRRDSAELVLLVSHLGRPATQQILGALPDGERPRIVMLTAADDEAAAPVERQGILWIGAARRGRSVSLIEAEPTGAGWAVTARTEAVADGPVDPAVQGWVEECFAAQRAGKLGRDHGVATSPPVTACASCHAGAVRAWRGTAHRRAVATLRRIGRDVAGCLRCHSERMRRDGLRPTPGDGVTCATCHDGLDEHLRAPRGAMPSTLDRAGCEGCHTRENSRHFDYTTCLAAVARSCSGEPRAVPVRRR